MEQPKQVNPTQLLLELSYWSLVLKGGQELQVYTIKVPHGTLFEPEIKKWLINQHITTTYYLYLTQYFLKRTWCLPPQCTAVPLVGLHVFYTQYMFALINNASNPFTWLLWRSWTDLWWARGRGYVVISICIYLHNVWLCFPLCSGGSGSATGVRGPHMEGCQGPPVRRTGSPSPPSR